MGYKEDDDLPGWAKNPECDKDEKEFHSWYKREFQVSYCSPKSPRYYQMRRAWMAAKEYYK